MRTKAAANITNLWLLGPCSVRQGGGDVCFTSTARHYYLFFVDQISSIQTACNIIFICVTIFPLFS